jgi:Tol biopolymer transport system component
MYGKRLALGASLVALVVAVPGALSSPAAQSAKRGLFAFALSAETQTESGATADIAALKVGLLSPDGSWRLIAEGLTPAFSPDGRVLAIAHYRYERRSKFSSPSGIVLHRLDGTPIRRLTFGEDVHPTWSPSGRKLAFTRRDCVGSRPCIFTIGRDGTDRRLLVKNGYNPSWSARGQIAFQRERVDYQPDQVWTTTPRATHARQLTHKKSVAVSEPDWSPSGNKLVVVRSADDPGGQGLAVMNADGSGQHWLLSQKMKTILCPRTRPGHRTVARSPSMPASLFTRFPRAGTLHRFA